MPRRPRRQTDCRLHHVTTRGNNRQAIFEDPADRERFYDLLHVGLAANDVDCHQDVLMGNHVHLLLEGDMVDVSAVMWFVSHRYALGSNQRRGRINHLLGRRFYASEIPDARAVRAVSVYIAMNPVRAGLCRHPWDWPFGSYRALVLGEMPRAHLDPVFTRQLFAARGTTFEAAVEAAVVQQDGGRPPLKAILPPLERLTQEHVRHARQIYGYTVPEIAAHYRRSARSIGAMAR